MQENWGYEKFRYHGLPFAKELQIVFENKSAAGEEQFKASSIPIPIEHEDKDEFYRPHMDLVEGSGDIEEELPGASIGITNDLEGVNLTSKITLSGPSNSGSHVKRKRNEGCGKGKKQKILG